MLDVPQGSEEWLAQRLGKATASRMADICARTKSGWGASRAAYEAELICERLTGDPAPRFTNAAMAWGTETEPEAAAAYAFRFDADLTEVGFVDHPSIDLAGASPDRLVGAEGMVEFKCPTTATHLGFLLEGRVPDKYLKQMTWQMACTGRAWCDFVSYDPRMSEPYRMFVQRFERDEKEIAELEGLVREFLDGVAAKIEALEARYQ